MQLPNTLFAHLLRAGDVITICGRREVVVRMEITTAPLLPGRTVHVFVQGEPSDDPFLMRPSDTVPVHSRTA